MRFEDGEDTLVRGAERELPLLRGRSKSEAAHVAQQRAGLAPAAVPRAGAEQGGVGVRRRPHSAPPHPVEQREGVREGRLANRLRGEAERRARVDALEPLALPASAARDRQLGPLEQLRRRRPLGRQRRRRRRALRQPVEPAQRDRRAQGGDVILGESPQGGLRATVRLPV